MRKVVKRYICNYIRLFFIAELAIILLYIISLILPWNLTRLTDRVIYGEEHTLLANVILVYVILFLMSTVVNLAYAFIWQTINNKFVVQIKTDMYNKLLRSKAKYLSSINTGDAVARVEWDSDQFIHTVIKNGFHFFNSIIMCIVIIILICRHNIIVGGISILMVILPVYTTKKLSKKTEKITSENRNNAGILAGKVFEIFSGFREIKLFNAGLWAENQVTEPLEKVINTSNKQNIIALSVQKAAEGISTVCTIALYIYATHLVTNGKMTIGVFLAIVQYVSLLNYKFDWILTIYNDWHWRKVSIRRCCDILELETENSNGIDISEICSIDFKGVSFAYDDNTVLNNVSFKINKGEVVGLVGISGVGKSTIVSLLTKLYEVQSGEILINNINIKEIDTYKLRNLIGVVSQDIRLFNESVRYNLVFDDLKNDSDIDTVLKKAQIYDKVNNMSNGLDTVVVPEESGLSGGQMQRIMIARMLIKDSELYICDEATSALDVNTESIITNELKVCMKSKMGIVISHRYNSLSNCDKIIVLKDGKVEAIGTDKILNDSCDEYISLFGGNAYAKA